MASLGSRSSVDVPVMMERGPTVVEVVLDVPATHDSLAPRVLLMHGFARGPRVLDDLADHLEAHLDLDGLLAAAAPIGG